MVRRGPTGKARLVFIGMVEIGRIVPTQRSDKKNIHLATLVNIKWAAEGQRVEQD